VVIELDGESFVLVYGVEGDIHLSVWFKACVAPVHVFPLSTGEEDAQHVVKLFPKESASVDKGVVEEQEGPVTNYSDGTSELQGYKKLRKDTVVKRSRMMIERATGIRSRMGPRVWSMLAMRR
jgi:hypothetical protein